MKSSARAVKKVVKSEKKPKLIQAELGRFFQKKRELCGMNLSTLAKHLEISVEQLEECEAGLRKIPMNQVYSMTNALNISPDEVIKLLHKLQNK